MFLGERLTLRAAAPIAVCVAAFLLVPSGPDAPLCQRDEL